MKSLQPVTSSATALFRSLPVPARVIFLSAFGIGVYTMIRWLVK